MRIPSVDAQSVTLSRVLRDQARHIGSHTFLLSVEQAISYADADRRVEALAKGLKSAGVVRGSSVALLMNNSLDFVYLVFALNRLGAVSVPISTEYRGTFLRHALVTVGAAIAIVDDECAVSLGDVQAEVPSLRAVIVRDGGDRSSTFACECHDLETLAIESVDSLVEEGGPDDVAMVLFTSGTTGPSKGVAHTNMAWIQAASELGARRDIRSDDVFHVALPLFHAGAWGIGVISAMLQGLPVAIDTKFSVSGFWSRIRYFGATQLLTTSAMHMWLLDAPPRRDDRDNPARVWAPVPLHASRHAELMERFGVEYLWFTYGQTEGLMLTTTFAGRPYKDGSAGWPRPSLEMAVVDDFDEVLGPNQAGELVVRPRRPHGLMAGYWNDDRATVQAVRNLWYHTGDTGRIDEDGEVFFISRRTDSMRVRGENVSAQDLEGALCEHPEIVEAAAFAVSAGESREDDIMVVLIRSADSAITEEEIWRYCREQVPRFAVPRYIEFVADLPRTPTNRVMKHELRDRGVNPTTWERPDDRGSPDRTTEVRT
jgi:crotonobetaine/carnitine-CoA ligase